MGEANVKVVVKDLREDARWWDSISTELREGLLIMSQGCLLPYGTFDGLSDQLGATAGYQAAFEKMATLLAAAVEETGSISTRLRSTAHAIQEADDGAAAAQKR